MTISPFTGVIPPVLTPLHEDGSINTDALRQLVDHLIAGGVDGLFALGSSSEAAFLTRDQRRLVTETIIDHTGGRVPVAVGVIDTTTPRVLEHVADAVELGAQGLVATAPFYTRTHTLEIEEHFTRIHDAAPDLPLYAYNIPVSVHVTLDNPLLLRLAAAGVLAGVKDSAGSDGALRGLIEARDEAGLENFRILTGSETTVDFAYLAGADGVVPGLGNVNPADYAQLHRLCMEHRWDEAAQLQKRINHLFRIITVGDQSRMSGSSAGLGAFKTALVRLGVFPNAVMCPPHQYLSGEETAEVNAIVDRFLITTG